MMSSMLGKAYAPIAPARVEWDIAPQRGRGQVSGSFEQLALGGESGTDGLVLKNGDSLSGRVVAVKGDVVRFAADMIEGELSVPFSSLNHIWFKKAGKSEKAAVGEIALAEGGRFGAFIQRVDGENVYFRTILPEDSTEMAVPVEKVASIGLSAEPLVLLEADFADEASSPFTANGGEWIVYKGQLLQGDPSYSDGVAYTHVQQWGRMRYSWTVHGKDWVNGAMYILASSENPGNGGSGYRIHLEHSQLAVYKGQERSESQVFYCSVGSAMARARITVEYDCATGEMRIWLNDRQMAHLRDKEPAARSGEYVALLARGRVAFDDIRVEQFGGDVPLSKESAGRDTVVLRNGDRVVGDVRAVSDRYVAVVPRLLEKELALDRASVLQIVFDGRRSAPARGVGVIFWNNGRLEGKIRSLEDGVVFIDNEDVGKLMFDTESLKSILLMN